MDATTNSDTNKDATYSHMVGVFRARTNAEQALYELKQGGFRETELRVYDPHPAEEADDFSQVDSGMRFLLQVLAEGREQEAVEILVSNGANNADIPLGTSLFDGSIIESSDAQVITKSPAEEPSDSFFGNGESPGLPR